ncbi:MAG: hypothetical protein ACEQSR_01225 [Candidatus Methylacidiphilales bacterium]
MKNKHNSEGFNRFQLHLSTLNQILEAAQLTNEPALVVYKSAARQSLFYLQALARIYKGIHNKKRFEKMRLSFKAFEDQLGKVDYYDGFIKLFSKNKAVPKAVLENLNKHFELELSNLSALLASNNWLNTENGKIESLKKELATADWKSPNDDKRHIANSFIKQIEEIEYLFEMGILNFKDLEHGVHEFRRQLRWISIYAQALNGFIQLKMVENVHPALNVYLTKQVLESNFNKMPEVAANSNPIFFQSANFYALSWFIAESGKLKDEGLTTVCLETMLMETGTSQPEAQKLALKILVKTSRTPKQVKEEMEVLADTFMYDAKVLFRLKRDILREMV